MPAENDRIKEHERAAAAAKVASFKKKQILVVVLLVGLLVAILTQPEKQDAGNGQLVESTRKDQTEASAANDSPKVKASESPEMRAVRLAQIRQLSRIELDEITRLELLAPEPLHLLQKQRNRVERVQAIYGTSTNRAALVGQSIIRGGQPLPDGQQVLEITTDGIQLAR